MNENSNEILKAIDAAFDNATATTTNAKPATGAKWADPEAYRQATGKRFRMSKEEKATHGDSPEGRQAAFLARQEAGTLPS